MQLTLPPDLYNRVLQRIDYEQELIKLQKKLLFYLGVITASLPLFLLAAKDFLNSASQSGFMQLLRLLTSDFSLLTSHLSDYLLSLLESLPIISIALTSLLFLFLTLSLIKFLITSYDIRRISKIKNI